MIEAMKRGRAWEYEYYESCNIAEALQGATRSTSSTRTWGATRFPLASFRERQFCTRFIIP